MQNILKSKVFVSVMLMAAAVAAAIVIAVNVSHSGSDLQTQLDLGKKCVSELDYDNAVIAYETALEIDPYCLEAYLGLSDVYLALGQQDKAIEVLEQAKALLPDSAEVYADLAQLYASQDQIGLVVSTLEEGIEATDSDWLREILRGYQLNDEEPVQAQSSQEDGKEGSEEPSPEPNEGPSIAIGIRKENPLQRPEPVLIISKDKEDPVTIPLIAPAPVSVPTASPSVNVPADTGSLEESMDSEGEGPGNSSGSEAAGNGTEDGGIGAGSGEGNPGGGSSTGDGGIAAPVTPSTGISGSVYGIDGQAIEGVTVKVLYSDQSQEPVVVSTDTIGQYIQELPEGTYRIVLSKEGYAELNTTVSVVDSSLTSGSYIMLTTEESMQSASLKGVVISAVDSQKVEGVTVSLLNGFDSTSNGDQNAINHAITGNDGEFSIEQGVNAGYYTVEASKDGYSTYHHNETIKPGENELAISMSPVIKNCEVYRIVLTWGETPRDLDSHLISSGDDNYHVYFANKNSSDGKASLDWDDTSSYGPETITVEINENNSYIYAVHNFSDGGASHGQNAAWNLANSGAKVMVYGDDGLIFDGNVPTNEEGTTWEVFRIENGRLVVTNHIGFEHPSQLSGNSPRTVLDDAGKENPVALSSSEDGEENGTDCKNENSLLLVEETVNQETVSKVEENMDAPEAIEITGEEVDVPHESGTEETELRDAGAEEVAEPEKAGMEEVSGLDGVGTEEVTEPEEIESGNISEPDISQAEKDTENGFIEAGEAMTEPEAGSMEETPDPALAETGDTVKPEELGTEESAGEAEAGTDFAEGEETADSVESAFIEEFIIHEEAMDFSQSTVFGGTEESGTEGETGEVLESTETNEP